MWREFFTGFFAVFNSGLNLKINQVYVIDDITNLDYRQAVENYILVNTEGV
ncbi:hypothetical protein [Metabacillus fastidiosus]|uniref:hypothetical protein n=1 Tax=Metabacillus fastidiosus TaxID=1458 RepID=UPI002E1C4B98|nr:hypothetical protein [Metabacillus fastidiosus]